MSRPAVQRDAPNEDAAKDSRDAESIEAGVESLDTKGAAPNIAKLFCAEAKLYSIAVKIREKGTHFLADDDKLIASSKNVAGTAAALSSLASGLNDVLHLSESGTLDKTAEGLDKIEKLLGLAQFAANIHDDAALQAFEDEPNADTAEAWAKHVGTIFDSMSSIVSLIPDGALPGFIGAYFKGLLKAPKTYIDAFLVLMKAHYGRIDAEAGISGAEHKVVDGDKIMWEGDLYWVYYHAFFVQPRGLQDFMTANRNSLGVDLWKTTESIGRSLVAAAVQTQHPDPKYQPWLDYLQQ